VEHVLAFLVLTADSAAFIRKKYYKEQSRELSPWPAASYKAALASE